MQDQERSGKVSAKRLMKPSRSVSEGRYDFSLCTENELTDPNNKGRPPGVGTKRRRQANVAVSSSSTPSTSSATACPFTEVEVPQNVPAEFVGVDQADFLSNADLYVLLLKQERAMYTLTDDSTVFSLCDYDVDRGALKMNAYVVVWRRPMSFCDAAHWMYMCSCEEDSLRREIVKLSPDTVNKTFDEFSGGHSLCRHICAMQCVMTGVDATHGIIPCPISTESDDYQDDGLDADRDSSTETTNDIVELATKDGCTLSSVHTPQGYGVVEYRPDTQTVRCLTCRSSMSTVCDHATKYRGEVCDDTRSAMERIMDTPSSTEQRARCYTTLSIPFDSSPMMQLMYSMPTTDRFTMTTIDDEQCVLFAPTIVTCRDCHAPLQPSPFTRGNLYTAAEVLPAVVQSKTCAACDTTTYYDGIETFVINMGGYFFTHEVMRHFMYAYLSGRFRTCQSTCSIEVVCTTQYGTAHHTCQQSHTERFALSRTTIYTEHTILCRKYKDAGFLNTPSYNEYKEAWYAFLDLLSIDFDGGFECKVCGQYPSVVVMDATSVAFRKTQLSRDVLNDNTTSAVYDATASSHTRVAGRTLLPRSIRTILLKFVNGRKGMEQCKVPDLLESLRKEGHKLEPLALLISHILEDCNLRDGIIYCKPVWKDFFLVLASSNAFCSFIPPNREFFVFLETRLSLHDDLFNDQLSLSTIQKCIPVLFSLLSELKSAFPFGQFVACLPLFCERVMHPFEEAPSCPSEAPCVPTEPLAYFPGLPLLRTRGAYKADQRVTSKQDKCNKLSRGHPHLLPGVFTLYCHHGICYGFEVMKYHESPNVPFSILRTRFPSAPELIIYDNACTLHTYSLNRDAKFFQKSQFAVDALHYKNHTACGPTYSLKKYPEYRSINSQVVEQSNSRLQRIKSSLSYMTQNNFKNHCKLYIWDQNRNVNLKL